MKSRCTTLAMAALAVCAMTLFAAKKGFWDTKPYTEWAEKDVDKLLRDSPWARTIPLSTGPESSMRSRGTGEDETAPAGDQAYRPQPKLVVTWYAKPIREALVRRIQLNNPSPSQDQIDKLLNRPASPFYELLVTGWNPGRNRAEAVKNLKEGTYLQKKNKDKLPLADAIQPQMRSDPLVLRFSREQEGRPVLSLEDKEVLLVLRMGDNTIRVPFKLTEMTVRDQLQLQ